ncbi:hypothetical protein ASPVEDRAFT_47930 [Aspergillus versicolor CBS 583.65]|uniref:Aldehyde dehydrogenase domain-containing protein n=1 Tax=Aspergillus versicolor CBS 583.65 TaxID=1036611 RepID=A0A1L9Q4Q4_ASPVE|nr:uncharacterized protein ASPVEDRAFT_47930 [Aspergillus versicolor CBS 583.65]OJJ08754.1 hypothetical protein ASPVEDRAFT_47930 [Aspergillus versicolor CBS 583.65]
MIPLWSTPYALITGNTVVLKPSEKAPSVSWLLAEAAIKAGFPPGVFNVIHGTAAVAQLLVTQPEVKAINFVGSESAAKQVHDLAQSSGKRIQAECGGKNHGVILEDAGMMPTLFAIAGSAFGAAGQRCMGLNVAVFVGTTREWIPKLIELAESMVLGCGGDEEAQIGPLIDRAAKDKVVGIIGRAVEEGAMLLLDGRDAHVPDYPRANFLGPTVLMGIETYMECYQMQIFGPVLICMQVGNLDEAIQLINDNKYGHSCTIFTSSGKNAHAFQRRVNIGQVGVNIPLVGEYDNHGPQGHGLIFLAPYGTAVRTSNKASFLGGEQAFNHRHVPG